VRQPRTALERVCLDGAHMLGAGTRGGRGLTASQPAASGTVFGHQSALVTEDWGSQPLRLL
jgi:hypothetical protein